MERTTERRADALRCPLCHGPLDPEAARRCTGCDTPFHAGCLRELGGCSTLGCAQAGRQAVAAEKPVAPRPRGSVPMAVAANLLAWFLLAVSALLALPCALLGALSFARARRWRAVALTLALSPAVLPPLAVGNAVLGYLTGTASIRTFGLVRSPAPLDPVVRCPIESGGCVPDGTGELWNLPNNLTLRALTAAFGPQRGAYRGPLPADEEVWAAIERPLDPAAREALEARTRDVDPGSFTLPACAESRGRSPRRAALLGDRLLVLADQHGPGVRPCFALVDLEAGRLVQVVRGRPAGR
ncbi:MAG: PHD finger domain-containing protein [Planctomycetes bacterium]|nr:PHD finger domain-containing protein [Planctomycetota bacterium]